MSPHRPTGGPLRLGLVRIPGGDLAPARRRHYGGSYGRRRHRRNVRLGAALLLVVVGAGAVYALRRDDTRAPERLTSPLPTSRPCATPTVAPPATAVAVPVPQQVRFVLLNGTARSGLAKTIGNQLAAAGFTITAQGNSPRAVSGDSLVQYGPGALPAGTLVHRWVQGSRLVPAKLPAGAVQLVLGSGFGRLSTPAEVAAAGTSTAPVPAVAASSCPS
jgi:hypothetical protein